MLFPKLIQFNPSKLPVPQNCVSRLKPTFYNSKDFNPSSLWLCGQQWWRDLPKLSQIYFALCLEKVWLGWNALKPAWIASGWTRSGRTLTWSQRGTHWSRTASRWTTSSPPSAPRTMTAWTACRPGVEAWWHCWCPFSGEAQWILNIHCNFYLIFVYFCRCSFMFCVVFAFIFIFAICC